MYKFYKNRDRTEKEWVCELTEAEAIKEYNSKVSDRGHFFATKVTNGEKESSFIEFSFGHDGISVSHLDENGGEAETYNFQRLDNFDKKFMYLTDINIRQGNQQKQTLGTRYTTVIGKQSNSGSFVYELCKNIHIEETDYTTNKTTFKKLNTTLDHDSIRFLTPKFGEWEEMLNFNQSMIKYK